MADHDTAASTAPSSAPAVKVPDLTVRENGALIFDAMAVGRIETTDLGGARLVVNLGWAKAAGLSVRVEDDPAVERHRNGITLDRPA